MDCSHCTLSQAPAANWQLIASHNKPALTLLQPLNMNELQEMTAEQLQARLNFLTAHEASLKQKLEKDSLERQALVQLQQTNATTDAESGVISDVTYSKPWLVGCAIAYLLAMFCIFCASLFVMMSFMQFGDNPPWAINRKVWQYMPWGALAVVVLLFASSRVHRRAWEIIKNRNAQ